MQAIAGVFYLSMPSCRAGTYFFEIKKVCKKILPQGFGFLGNAKRIMVLLVNGLRVVPFSAICRVSLAPRNVSNQVQGACPLWGQFFICKIKNGGLDNEKRSEAPVAYAIAAFF